MPSFSTLQLRRSCYDFTGSNQWQRRGNLSVDLDQLRSRKVGSESKWRIGERPEDGRGHRHGRGLDADRDGDISGRPP